MASPGGNSSMHGAGRGLKRGDSCISTGRRMRRRSSDPAHPVEELREEEEDTQHEKSAGSRTELQEGKRLSGASIWSPPHLFHRHSQNQPQHSHEHNQQNHHHQPQQQQQQQQQQQNHHSHLRMHLNPLQYLQHDSRPRSMSDFRQPLSITTTTAPSSSHLNSNHSPLSRASSKASSPTVFYQNNNQSTLYHPPHLHFTHQQPVKETHRLDLDFDPISGRKSINKYEIIDEIGRGTHGKVKLGRDLDSEEYVAIKIVERHSRPRLGKLVRQEDEKVRREIAILKKCRHPNVVRLIEVIDDPASKKVYLVLEYVELGEIVWRKVGPKDVLRREMIRLKRELTGEIGNEEDNLEEEVDSEEERVRKWKRRRRKQLKEARPSTATSTISGQPQNDENPNFWSLELGGLTEEDDEITDDDYPPSVDSDDRHEPAIVDAPHMPPLDSDTEEPPHHIPSLSMVALGPDPNSPPYSFSQEDLQHVPAMTFEQARSAFRDTVLGLEYLHYHGIIHRDIKPANLLCTKNYRVKISDFGVSYLGRGVGDEEEEEDGERKGSRKKKDHISGRDEEIELAKTVGTPAFFAPELCFFDTSKPRPQITAAIDVWALGVTLYCLVFARCPFLADGEFELFNVIAKQELYIPTRRIRPIQGYSASVKSLSRPSSSNRPRSLHHQRTPSGLSAKTAPIYPRPMSGYRGKGVPEDQETEFIPDDLRDLLHKLLTKDPAKRITLEEVKSHPWVLQGVANPSAWLKDTDPERVSGGGRIEVNQEEMEKAVVPASWTTGVIKQVKSGLNRLRQKMGMGGSGSEGGTPKKEKVGLHPLASRGNDTRGPHSFLGSNRPGSSSSNSTLQEGEVLNRYSLSLQVGTPYKAPKVVAPPPISTSSLTRLLNPSPAKSTPPSTNPNTPTKSIKDGKSFPSPGKPNSPGPVKKFLNDSHTSLANSLSRSLSRSSYNSEFTAMSGAESPSPSAVKKDKKDRILPSSLLRRTRSTLSSGGSNNVNSNDPFGGAGGRGSKVVRRATSSNLGHEITNSPSPSSQSTIRRFPSSSSQESPNKDPVPKIRLATVQSRESAQIQFLQQPERKKSGPSSQSGSATTRSRRSSASSNSITHAREGVAATLGGWFGKGKRLVRSFSRSRDTLASESEAVMSTSGGSGDDEGNHRGGLRISMLRRKRSSGLEASPVVSKVNAMGTVRSGNNTAAASPVAENGDCYFDMEHGSQADASKSVTTTSGTLTASTITASHFVTTTTTTTTSTSTSSNALCDIQEAKEIERRQWADGLKLRDTSPDDFIMWERQSKVRERREESSSYVQQLPHHSASDSLITSSSDEKMYSQRGHRHTDTTTSSLTESTSFPSIQSMMDSSAASSVSADAGWPTATKNAIRQAAGANRDSGIYSLNNGNGSVAVIVEDEVATPSPQNQHGLTINGNNAAHLSLPSQQVQSQLNSAYHSYIHGKADEDDDGDDEALCLDLGTSRRKSQNLADTGRAKTIPVGVLQHQHHKRAVSSASARSRASETDREKSAPKEGGSAGGKERVRRRRSSKSGGLSGQRGRSRSNTASSSIIEGSVTVSKERERERRQKEKIEREREKAALPALPVPVAR